LGPIDFVAVARACGAAGFHVEASFNLRPAIEAALKVPGPAVIEVVVDPEEGIAGQTASLIGECAAGGIM
jgi:thiamine pyrophosphate-dependent acetolactate synthase large subunit-like protein